MGLLSKLFGSKFSDAKRGAAQWQTVTEYQPVFSSWDGKMYEQYLVRSCIERIAISCSKLVPEVIGSANPRIARAIETSPSNFMTWPKFLARCATIYFNDNNLFIVPQYKPGTDTIVGIYPLKPVNTEVIQYQGDQWFRFYTGSGQTIAVPAKDVCLITRFQYESDVFGSENNLDGVLQLMHAQEQGQKSAIKNNAVIRFIAALKGQIRPEDLKKKRKEFAEDNLSSENQDGILVYDQTFDEVKQIEPKSWTIPADEMRRIEDAVFRYFGINDSILKNSYDENEWGAFYEGPIEAFAVQLGEGLSHMLYTQRQRPNNRIEFSSSRLQYASNSSKRNMIRDTLDRGVIMLNEAREIMQLPPVEGGDAFILRGEYKIGATPEELLQAQQQKADEQKAQAGELADIDRDDADADLDRGDSEGYGSGDDFDSGTGGRRAD